MNGKNHLTRVLTSILLLPLLVAVVYFGKGLPFNILILGCVILCMREFFRLAEGGGMPCYRVPGAVVSILLMLIFMLGKSALFFPALTGSGLITFLAALGYPLPLSERVPRLCSTFLGIFYIPWMLGFLILIRGLAGGAYLIFFFMAVIWCGDTFAYYTGSLLGKHLLCPAVSPKKTVEGVLGGLLGSSLAASILGPFWLPGMPFVSYPLVGLALGSVGQLGDLSESVLKRWAGVKESGALLPGHGGLLDRIDGLILSAPVFYYYLILTRGGRGR